MNTSTASRLTAPRKSRTRVSFNNNWSFAPGDPPEEAASQSDGRFHAPTPGPDSGQTPPTSAYADPATDVSGWRKVSLPHDWSIEAPFRHDLAGETDDLEWWGVGWYRKTFKLTESPKTHRFHLDFDGAMSSASVWVNGHLAAGCPCGYTSFRVDLTPYLNPPPHPNVVAVRLGRSPDSSRGHPGGGIHRNVWLVTTAHIYVGHWGSHVITTSSAPRRTAAIRVRTEIENATDAATSVSVRTEIFPLNGDNKIISSCIAETTLCELTVSAQSRATAEGETKIERPRLWSLDQPNRYLARTFVEKEGSLVDQYDTIFGVRSARFDTHQGLVLNGRRVKLKGVSYVPDFGALGAALHPRALERQIEILREMGANAIRTAHTFPAPELLDLCDRLGLLVFHETLPPHPRAHDPSGSHTLSPDSDVATLRALIRRDRNHPCVVLWTTGTHAKSQHWSGIVRSEDPTRQIAEKLERLLSFDHADKDAAALSSRGEYVFPANNMFAGGAAAPGFQTADFASEVWNKHASPVGEFAGNAFDHPGAPSAIVFPSRSSYSGILDRAGFRKDRFYFYQARWRPDLPMVHILPHWNWPDRIGQVTPVHVYTSGDEADLFLNGRFLGRQRKKACEYRLRWDNVLYEPGVLRVDVFKYGKPWAEASRRTTGAASKLHLAPDRCAIRSDGYDLSFVTLMVQDDNDFVVPRAKLEVTFSISGPGVILATDNGDPTDPTPFSSPRRRTFNGLALAIIQRHRGETAPVTLRADARDLDPAAVCIRALPN